MSDDKFLEIFKRLVKSGRIQIETGSRALHVGGRTEQASSGIVIKVDYREISEED